MEFKEFEKILKQTIKNFKEIDKIGFIGIMGSANINHDLDVIISPNKNTKKGEFLKILCGFFETLGKNLKEQNSRLIVFYYSPLQNEVEYLSKRTKKDILLHLISITDITPPHPQTFKTMLDTRLIYYGKPKNITQVTKTSIDRSYNHMLILNCLYSHYPKELETKKMQHSISYIIKHAEGKIDLKNKTNKQIYFECCNYLDSIAKEI